MSSDVLNSPGKQLLFHQTGKPAEVLELTPFTPKQPASGEVLVRILAAPINPADLNTIEGTYGVKPALPAVPGIEGCGVVDGQRGGGFQTGRPGDFPAPRLDLGHPHDGSGGFVVQTAAGHRSRAGGDAQGESGDRLALAAWIRSTRQQGDWIVQNLGNSAVGRCVIQLARDLGIRTISFVRRAEVVDELATSARIMFSSMTTTAWPPRKPRSAEPTRRSPSMPWAATARCA